MPASLRLLRDHRDFRLLFAARSISLFGDWLSLIAVIALLREVVGSDAAAISGVLILKLLPMFLAGPLAGVVADRVSRRTIMLVADVVRVLFVLGLLAAPAVPHPVFFVNLLILLQVVASAFFEPARSAALPRLVPADDLATANALGAAMWSVMFALGAATGGLLTDALGWRAALVVDAATYLVSAALVARIADDLRPRRRRGRVDWLTLTGLPDLRDGLRFVGGRPDVATVLGMKTGWGVAGAATLFLTLFGERVYPVAGRPDFGVTLLFMARAVGTGVGPLLGRRLADDRDPVALRRLVLGAFLWSAAWYLVFAASTDVWLAVASIALAHLGGSTLWVHSSVMLQRIVPDELRGRVIAADLGLATLSISASTWIYGQLADGSGADLRGLVRVMAATLVVPGLVWWLAARRWPADRPQEGDA